MSEYYIIGNSFKIKSELEIFGCKFDKKRKCMKTPPLDKNSLNFKRIKSLCTSFFLEMVPVRSQEEQKNLFRNISKEIKD